jgi:hypothetical protein
MKVMLSAVIAAGLLTGLAHAAYTGSMEKTAEGVTWQAGVDGVKIDFDNAQHVRRIYSKVAQAVTIADRRGIQTATTIAEEKAKANIVRFLQQDVISGRAVTEIDATLSQSVQKNGAAGTGLSTTDQRNIVQGLTEFTGSVSTGTLRGVIVLETGFDPAAKEAWVVAGVSDKTMAAASAARDMMANPQAEGAPTSKPGDDPLSAAPNTPAQIKRSGSEF